MKLKHHLSESLRLDPAPSPWPRMVLCSLGVTLPLIIGHAFGDGPSSIYGALFGFTLILNDHFGPYARRLIHLLTTGLFLTSAFLLGLLLQGHEPFILITLFILAFILGKAKGLGLELERMLLTSTFQFLTAAQTPDIQSHFIKPVLYGLVGLANYILCLSIVYLLMKHAPNFQKSKRQELKEAIKKKDTQRYAFTLATVASLGLFITNYYKMERGYWIVSTILIVMMPTRTLSFQRSFQRVLGTFLGGIIASAAIYYVKDPYLLIAFSAIAAFLSPLGLIKNYWLANVFIASLILFFLEIASAGQSHGDFSLAILRLKDIAIGSIVGAIGTLLAFPHSEK